MPEPYFQLALGDRREALEVAAQELGRPAAIIEKDIYVVWALSALERATYADHLVFKGGTSLSKAHALIDRFSEDVDLTYDLRAFAPDLIATGTVEGWPRSRSQADRWSTALLGRLGTWISTTCAEHVRSTAKHDGVAMRVDAFVDPKRHRHDLFLLYESAAVERVEYVSPAVRLEFGARGTGEPNQRCTIRTDASTTRALSAVTFPQASFATLAAERTLWEKATAAHAFCLQASFRGAHGFARHWYDLARMHDSSMATAAIRNRRLAHEVARWKSLFFRERGVDYVLAVTGDLRIVPDGGALDALRDDYERMRGAGLTPSTAPTFEAVLAECAALEVAANAGA